jgi:HEAT repeat protein
LAAEGTEKGRRWALAVIAESGLKPLLPEARRIHLAEGDGPLASDALLARIALGDREVVMGARDLLKGADEGLSKRVVRALGSMDDADTMRLVRAMRNDARAPVRVEVIRALVRTGASTAKDFDAGLRDVDPRVRGSAVEALMERHPTYVAAVAARGLANAGEPARVLEALLSARHRMEMAGGGRNNLRGQIATLEERLQQLISHPEPGVRGGAAELLFYCDDPIAAYQRIVDPTVEVQYALLSSLAERPPRGVDLDDALTTVERLRAHELLAVRVMANAAVWALYRSRAGEP